MRPAAEIWKGLNGSDRSEIVERLYGLSRGVVEWQGRCAAGEVSAGVRYGRLDFTVRTLREFLGEALGKRVTETGFVEIDGALKRPGDDELAGIVARLGELGTLLEDWAEACAAGRAVAWIVYGRLVEYVEELWDEVCWEGGEERVEP